VLQNSIVFTWANTSSINKTSSSENTNAEHEPTSVADDKDKVTKQTTKELDSKKNNEVDKKADEVVVSKPKLTLKTDKKKIDRTRGTTSHNIKTNTAKVSP
jgi:hypothetical protein